MPTSDGPGRLPVFVAPSHHQRSPNSRNHVPGRVAPVRLPPPAKALPPPPIKPHAIPPPRRATFIVSEENQRRERAHSRQQRKNTFICFGISAAAFFLTLILVLSLKKGNSLDGEYFQRGTEQKKEELFVTDLPLVLLSRDAENCPDHNPSLSSWNPGHQPQKAVVVRTGQLLKLESSATFLSLTIQSGGKLVRLLEPPVQRFWTSKE